MDVHGWLRNSRRWYLRYRRWLAAAAAAGCVTAVVHELAPPDEATSTVVVAAHDLAPGKLIEASDLRVVKVAPQVVPAGAIHSTEVVTGERLTGPLSSGEILTDTRILTHRLVRLYGADVLATPLRLPDAGVVALLEAGDHVDVFAASGHPDAPADQIVVAAPVIAVPAVEDRQGEGAIVVLALSRSDTARLAQASATTQLSIAVR